MTSSDNDAMWADIRRQAGVVVEREPVLAEQVSDLILKADSLEDALSHQLADKLQFLSRTSLHLEGVFLEVLSDDPATGAAIRSDLQAIVERDPACSDLLTPLLFYKGFKALTASRIAGALWRRDRRFLALHIQSMISEFYGVDIHPGAVLGRGIMLDHATGFVAGETSVIGDDVSILHAVTLGGTGKECGDRHPKIGRGVLIGAGAKILGNIHIGEGARIGANSVVLEDVPAHVTVAGVPAKVVGTNESEAPALEMDHRLHRPKSRQPG